MRSKNCVKCGRDTSLGGRYRSKVKMNGGYLCDPCAIAHQSKPALKIKNKKLSAAITKHWRIKQKAEFKRLKK